jgi:hypothetical protein
MSNEETAKTILPDISDGEARELLEVGADFVVGGFSDPAMYERSDR